MVQNKEREKNSTLVMGQSSQIKDIAFHKTILISDTAHKFGSSQATHTSDQMATNFEILTTPFGYSIC